MTNKIKEFINFFFRISVSGLLLWYLFAKIVNLSEMIKIIKSANIMFIFYSFLSFIAIVFFLLYRWFIYIKALGLIVEKRDVVRYYFIGLFGNLFLPSAIGGDIIKILGLCSENSQKARVVASVLLDRLSGFVAIVLIAIFSFIFGYNLIDDKSLMFPIISLGFVLLFLWIVLFNEPIYSFFCRVFNMFPKIKKKFMDLHYDISLMKNNKKEGYKAIFISCISQSTYALTFFLLAKAMHQDANIIYFLIFVPLICVASMLPSLGGLGVREAGSVYFFSKIGISAGVATSISLMSFFFMVIVGLIGGLIYVFTLSSGRLQHKQSIAD